MKKNSRQNTESTKSISLSRKACSSDISIQTDEQQNIEALANGERRCYDYQELCFCTSNVFAYHWLFGVKPEKSNLGKALYVEQDRYFLLKLEENVIYYEKFEY